MVTLNVSRDSTCAADDVWAPNAASIDVPADAGVEEVCRALRDLRCVPSVAGGSTWSLEHGGLVLAVLREWWAGSPGRHELEIIVV